MASNMDIPSDHSNDESRRTFPGCNIRMSSLLHDTHTMCTGCRGIECTHDDKCIECESWPEEVFASYAKHKKRLYAKSKSRKSKSSKSVEGNVKSSSGDSCSAVSGTENTSSKVILDQWFLKSARVSLASVT